VGKIWLKFIEEEKNPFGIPLRKKSSHNKIAPGDIIQVSDDFYVVHEVGARKMQIND
jgi:sorbitol-specific phosphotransferase system component IIA